MTHDHDAHAHDHSHGLVARSILRSRDGVKTVAISLAVLGAAALVQVVVFILSDSVALLADLIHNFGDALTAVPLGIAFALRSLRGEKIAGLLVVAACGHSPLPGSSASPGTRPRPRFGCAAARGCTVPP